MQDSTLAKRAWLLLFVATALVYFYGLGRAPLLGSDEPRYAEVAREMFLRGDVVTPTLGGHAWFEKPALVYWVAMLSYRAFGVSEWSARIGAAGAGVLTVVLVGWLGRQVEEATGKSWRWFGLASAALLASSGGLIVFSRGVNFDIFITLTIAASLACFFVAELREDARARRWLLLGFYAGIGASLLAKGLIGIVLPCGIVALYFVFRRRRPDVRRLELWSSFVAIAVAATWYAPVIARHGGVFVEQFIVQHHFARYVSNKYHHPQPFYYYLPIILLFALPWTPFLLTSLGGIRRWSWSGGDAASKLRLFALAWLVVPISFFSLSGSKLPGYILPALPGAALLAGERLASFLRREENETKAMRVVGVSLISLASIGLVYAAHDDLISFGCSLVAAAPLVVAGAFAILATRHKRTCVCATASAMWLMVIAVVSCALGPMARRESMREQLQLAAQRGYGASPIYNLHNVERSSEFYAAGRVVYDANGEPLKLEGANQIVEAARQNGGTVLVIVPVQYARQLTGDPLLDVTTIGDNGVDALVAVQAR